MRGECAVTAVCEGAHEGPHPDPLPGGEGIVRCGGRVVAALACLLLLPACWTSDTPAPFVKYGQLEGARSTGAHTVQPGDTVGSLAERYKLEVRDIMVANNLQPPYMLQPGQRLHLPPPRTYRVRGQDTLYNVSRLFNVSTTQIARLNNLPAPYVLARGQVIRLPAVAAAPSSPVETIALAPDAAERGVSLPPPVVAGGIEREELSPPQVAGVAIPAPPPQVANASLAAKVPSTTPPRSGAKFLKPVSGPILSAYGPKPGGLHNDGVNIKAPKGAPVSAAENGVVVYADTMKGYGNMVLIRHADRWMTAYAHLDAIQVARGATVRRGQTVGTVGTSGSVGDPQLHFEIRRGTDALNPEKYM